MRQEAARRTRSRTPKTCPATLIHELNQRYRAEFDRAERLQDELNDIRASRGWRFLSWLRLMTRVVRQGVGIRDQGSGTRMQKLGAQLLATPTELPAEGRVSIIIPFRDKAILLRKCLASLRKSTYANYDVVLVDNGSVEEETTQLLRRLQGKRRYCIVHDSSPFNFSHLCNSGAFVTRGDYLLFLNNDVEVITPDWLEQMLQAAAQPDVGIVGATLLYPDGMIQHAGLARRNLLQADRLAVGEAARDQKRRPPSGRLGSAGGSDDWSHVYRGMPADYPGKHGELRHMRLAEAVTGACLLIARDLFNQLGGFDERHAITLNDVDLCLRAQQLGRCVAITPHARLYHYESLSRGYRKEPRCSMP